MTRMVQCAKLGKEAEGLDFPPLPGELGKRIYESVSKEAWQAWLKHQTMLINENRLNMADPRARQYLGKQNEKFFFREGAHPGAPAAAAARAPPVVSPWSRFFFQSRRATSASNWASPPALTHAHSRRNR